MDPGGDQQAAQMPAQQSLAQRLSQGQRSLTFEFFPPRTDAETNALWQAIEALQPLRPDAVSVTFGAGGSRSRHTIEITAQILARTTLTPIAHLTCVGMSGEHVREVLAHYAAAGVHHVLALRGDPPQAQSALGEQAVPASALLPRPRPHHERVVNTEIPTAADLVSLAHQAGRFCVGVAAFPDGHPESSGWRQDLDALKAKQDAGAQFAITQFFFRPHVFTQLRKRMDAAGITLPLIAGIMPVTSLGQIRRFAQLCGTPLPNALVGQLEAVAHDPAAVRQVGIDHASDLCQRLIDAQVQGLHFYTLNRSHATRQIAENLGLHHQLSGH